MTKADITTLRRRYAGMALQGMISSSTTVLAAMDIERKNGIPANRILALNAIDYADALIDELIKKEG